MTLGVLGLWAAIGLTPVPVLLRRMARRELRLSAVRPSPRIGWPATTGPAEPIRVAPYRGGQARATCTAAAVSRATPAGNGPPAGVRT